MKKIHTIDVVILVIKKTDEWIRNQIPATFLIGYYSPKAKTLKHLGNVSSGLTLREKEAIGEVSQTIQIGEDKNYLYPKPAFVLEVGYQERRKNGLRFPKIQRIRFDKRAKDCLLP